VSTQAGRGGSRVGGGRDPGSEELYAGPGPPAGRASRRVLRGPSTVAAVAGASCPRVADPIRHLSWPVFPPERVL
jgi:hypothetical protein